MLESLSVAPIAVAPIAGEAVFAVATGVARGTTSTMYSLPLW